MHGDADEMLAHARPGSAEPVLGAEERGMRAAHDRRPSGVHEGALGTHAQRRAEVRAAVDERRELSVLSVSLHATARYLLDQDDGVAHSALEPQPQAGAIGNGRRGAQHRPAEGDAVAVERQLLSAVMCARTSSHSTDHGTPMAAAESSAR